MADRKKRVVKRKTSTRRPDKGGFQFTPDMIPAWANGAKETQFLDAYRMRAWEKFEQLSMPSTSEEPWRRTDIRKLATDSLRLADAEGQKDLPGVPDHLLESLIGEGHGGQIVFSPEGTTVKLSEEISQQGVIFTDLATAATKHPALLEKMLGSIVKADEGKFAALAMALAHNGVLLYVPKGVHIEDPLHSVLWGPGASLAYLSHLLVWVEDDASVTYVHEAASPNDEEQSAHAGIVELHVGESSNLRFIELQSWGDRVWNFSHERAILKRDAKLDWIFGALGSQLTKNFSEINLEGEGGEARMSGFYFTDDEQHLDHDTQQNHKAANTTSDLLFKGALEEKSRSVWQGMIYVAPDAQQTDGFQANRNLVLSKEARADSIPGLEIMADDVRCTHASTIGKIDDEELFYLLSRGISEKDARQIIVEGFFDPIMQRIPFDGVRARFKKAIVEKMK
jgi:Fe-S cluster assembly protein SufD